ncbi:MAG: twin-arginine translocase TatA/TatE family subunit [Candidatus Acidiferrum sp.]
MLSMTHMIVVFVIVLVVFGPQKLPELARGLGKLMAEFRKASTDFKSAFEQEMRDLDRQARQAERKKAAEAAVASVATGEQPATLGTSPGAETAPANLDADTRVTEALVVTPVAESVPRSAPELAQPGNGAHSEAQPVQPVDSAQTGAEPETSQVLSHDQQQPV